MTAISEILPAGAVGAAAVCDEVGADLFAEEEALVVRAATSRRDHFLAGRHCARQALSELGWPATAIVADRDGVPCWPPGVVGSISHSRGFAAAAVARAGDYSGLGIDVEALPGPEPHLMHLLAGSDEQARVAVLGLDDAVARTIIFGGKEAAYKCVFPTTREVVDFLQARLRIVELAGPAAGRFEVMFDPDTRAGQLEPVPGNFAVLDDRLLCAAYRMAGS